MMPQADSLVLQHGVLFRPKGPHRPALAMSTPRTDAGAAVSALRRRDAAYRSESDGLASSPVHRPGPTRRPRQAGNLAASNSCESRGWNCAPTKHKTQRHRTKMRETGLEPARYYYHQALNLARLPIPPFPQQICLVVSLSRPLTARIGCRRAADDLPTHLHSVPISGPVKPPHRRGMPARQRSPPKYRRRSSRPRTHHPRASNDRRATPQRSRQ